MIPADLIHPDTACRLLGQVERPGESKSAKYDRRKHHLRGLPRYTGHFKGYRYSEADVIERRDNDPKYRVQRAA